jgi:GAF domain
VSADRARAEFRSRVDATLQTTCELARALIGAHQAAMSLIVAGDWPHARKYFSLSDKYAAYRDFTMPARGVGVHALVVSENPALRLTQTELENHPAWLGYAEAAGSHQPLRGLLAVPIVGEDGLNYGLLQLSDKADRAIGGRDRLPGRHVQSSAALEPARTGGRDVRGQRLRPPVLAQTPGADPGPGRSSLPKSYVNDQRRG